MQGTLYLADVGDTLGPFELRKVCFASIPPKSSNLSSHRGGMETGL